MLFTTAAFAFLYLPVVVLVFFIAGRFKQSAGALWLFAASIFFYGYWMPEFTVLLLASILVNFLIGGKISRNAAHANTKHRAKAFMIAGVAINLGVLAYFKYSNFFIDTLRTLFALNLNTVEVTLPIGISFYTFTQIAFLADAYQRQVSEYKFVHYGLFVTYFPHLVAGPVLHHGQMMPQFESAQTYRFKYENFSAGLLIFCLGLFKKVVIADGMSPYADAVFNAAGHATPGVLEAWLACLAYTFQLYFDFSGYSDMAIGLSWMLNIQLPINFDSPYKARNIIEFWRRWHISLSNFLRDYLYITLGGNRHGVVRRYINLGLTMLLGGLWHGASWTFVFWGALHGVYLCINHAFRALTKPLRQQLDANRAFAVASWTITFLSVIVAWIFFRAPNFASAWTILAALPDVSRAASSPEANKLLWDAGLSLTGGFLLCALLAAIVVIAPNSNAIGDRVRTSWTNSSRNCSAITGASLVIAVFLVVLNEARDSVSAFIYFNF